MFKTKPIIFHNESIIFIQGYHIGAFEKVWIVFSYFMNVIKASSKLGDNGTSTINAESMFIFFLEKDTESISFWSAPYEDEI